MRGAQQIEDFFKGGSKAAMLSEAFNVMMPLGSLALPSSLPFDPSLNLAILSPPPPPSPPLSLSLLLSSRVNAFRNFDYVDVYENSL